MRLAWITRALPALLLVSSGCAGRPNGSLRHVTAAET